ncbi:tRNA (adenosine(37)-N6)-dimethylallyltransferase MiaA [Rhodobacteraceae bacterium SC52]|nr:tRNA (adenosine(37)-N6)-dimethylallyltransferase MiaA [Rhodobacteraceae bacterium SC52]
MFQSALFFSSAADCRSQCAWLPRRGDSGIGHANDSESAPLCFTFSPDRPVLIAGPTASGKSSLALAIAQEQGRAVVNADALQVFAGWPVLTAQPPQEDHDIAEHLLYGHLPFDASYSVGDWLRDVTPLLMRRPAPVVVGGTGLYLSALTEGLAEIPATNPDLRLAATNRRAEIGLEALVNELDIATRDRIDTQNPMRVQRAWEVLQQTGKGLVDWQSNTGPALLSPDDAHLIQIAAPPAFLTPRIAARFDKMMSGGALEEARAMLPVWNSTHQSARAIGAADLIALLRDEVSESQVIERAVVATRQYAKRQRTWFRRRMQHWTVLDAAALCGDSVQHTRKRP